MHTFLRPGQGYKKFMVKKKTKALTENRKPTFGGYEDVGEIIGVLATANQSEVEKWKQENHPITHKIVQYGVKNQAKPTNYLVLKEGEKERYFYIQGVSNPGELNHMLRYFVEERKDLKNG